MLVSTPKKLTLLRGTEATKPVSGETTKETVTPSSRGMPGVPV
jgi:hypothetical protein